LKENPGGAAMSKKHCKGCDEDKDIEDFNWKDKAEGIRQSSCRLCNAKYGREHYKHNKQAYIKKTKIRRKLLIEENKKILFAFLSEHPCVDCGNTDIRVLEFDHVRGKKVGAITRMLGNGIAWSTLETEIAKCEVRCGNCHRIKTSDRGGFWRNSFDY
jgi:hypothetical protein